MPLSTRFFVLSLLALLTAAPCLAQDEPDSLATQEALTVFLDCDRCDDDYIRREITFVNYVRDRTESQVHLLITDTAHRQRARVPAQLHRAGGLCRRSRYAAVRFEQYRHRR